MRVRGGSAENGEGAGPHFSEQEEVQSLNVVCQILEHRFSLGGEAGPQASPSLFGHDLGSGALTWKPRAIPPPAPGTLGGVSCP